MRPPEINRPGVARAGTVAIREGKPNPPNASPKPTSQAMSLKRWETEQAFDAGKVAAELRARVLAHQYRVQIAIITQEFGLLTEEEQDELLLDGEQLKIEIELWRIYG